MSWYVIESNSGKAVCELLNEDMLEQVDQTCYHVLTDKQYETKCNQQRVCCGKHNSVNE